MNYQNGKIIKPWGNEYELFVNENVSIWHLTIGPGHCTSLHSHPNKKTGLLILDGAAELSFLNSKTNLLPAEKIMIRHGVFHRTKNQLSTDLQLLEIETPVDKTDIVRLQDTYGRSGQEFGFGQTYEDVVIPKLELNHCLSLGVCNILPIEITCINQLQNLIDKHNYMILDGGVTAGFCDVIGPGDIASKKDLVTLASQFQFLPSYILDITHV